MNMKNLQKGFANIILVVVLFVFLAAYSTVYAGTALTITTTSPLPNGQVGTSYSTTLSATGNSPVSYDWSVTSGTLPPGLNIASGSSFACSTYGCFSQIEISGTPTTPGTYSFTVTLMTSGPSESTTKQFTLTVDPGTSSLSITTTSPLPNGQVGTSYSVDFAAAGSGPYGWEVVSGSLPPGLSFPPICVGCGVPRLSGTPTTAGTYNFTIKVTNLGSESATKQFSRFLVNSLE